MSIKLLQDRIKKFVDDRDWDQFHNPKDLTISLTLEATEVPEYFQWKNLDEMARHSLANKKEVAEELADVLYWVLLMSNNLNIDIEEALNRKMAKNEVKYSVDKAKGNHRKYTELEDM